MKQSQLVNEFECLNVLTRRICCVLVMRRLSNEGISHNMTKPITFSNRLRSVLHFQGVYVIFQIFLCGIHVYITLFMMTRNWKQDMLLHILRVGSAWSSFVHYEIIVFGILLFEISKVKYFKKFVLVFSLNQWSKKYCKLIDTNGAIVLNQIQGSLHLLSENKPSRHLFS